MIAIIDYGLGNAGSIKNMLKKLNTRSVITSKSSDIHNSKAIIIPGVGNFDQGVRNIEELTFFDDLNNIACIEKRPILGICLGMQLMTNKSEEGTSNGLGWIDAEVIRFSDSHGPVPNMGWGYITDIANQNLFKDMGRNYKFYFVHSYYVKCNDKKNILSRTEYGKKFVSSFIKDNLMGVQFHPEKSHQYGINFFKNWLDYYNLG